MEKYKMYVSVVHQQVYHHPDDSPWEYEVNVRKCSMFRFFIVYLDR